MRALLSLLATIALFSPVISDPLGGAFGSLSQFNGPWSEWLLLTQHSFMTQVHRSLQHTPDESSQL